VNWRSEELDWEAAVTKLYGGARKPDRGGRQ
jgi:hypothetical protein